MSSFSSHIPCSRRVLVARFLTVSTLLLVHSSTAHAQTPSPSSLTSQLWQTLASLIAVVILAFVCLRVGKTLYTRLTTNPPSTQIHTPHERRSLYVVETLTLSATRAILLVQASNALLVVASTEHGLSLLCQLDEHLEKVDLSSYIVAEKKTHMRTDDNDHAST